MKQMEKDLNQIFDKYTKTIWVNPLTPKLYIPSENILVLKQEILNLMEMIEKGAYKCKQK